MAAQREPIFAALFGRLTSVTEFAFTSRVFQDWDTTQPPNCPAMFLAKGTEESIVKVGMPPLWTLHAVAVMYCKNDEGPDVAPSIQLNELLTAWEGALERQPTEPPVSNPMFLNNPTGSWGTSLGGLCYSCQITGVIQIYEGTIAGTAQAVVPIDILTTA